MTNLAKTSDPEFYELVHYVAEILPAEESPERRRDQRQSFPSIQRIALRHGAELPADSEFVDVQCYDLTGGGFSFLLPSQPNFDQLVVALESQRGIIHVAAEVRHTADVLVDAFGRVERIGEHAADTGGGEHRIQTATPMVLVGCRFTERTQES